MKQIPLLQGKALLVELPEGAENTSISDSDYFDKVITSNQHLTWNIDNGMLDGVSLPPGTWEIVGLLPEVSESEAAGMVEHKIRGQERGLYRNYLYHDIQARHIMKETALESLESAILAEGYYLDVNPIPVPDYSEGHVRFDETVEHAKAQSRVLSRERCLLLRRVEG